MCLNAADIISAQGNPSSTVWQRLPGCTESNQADSGAQQKQVVTLEKLDDWAT